MASGKSSNLRAFLQEERYTHFIDDDSDPEYVGQINIDGDWLIIQITSDATIEYAGQKNNPDYSSITDAWDDRLTLTYGLITEAV